MFIYCTKKKKKKLAPIPYPVLFSHLNLRHQREVTYRSRSSRLEVYINGSRYITYH